MAHSQPNVDAEFDQVNVPVINNEIDVERGMLRQKGRQTGYDVQERESHGRLNAQAARKSCGCTARGEFCFVHFLDGSFHSLIKIPARLGWRQSTGRAQQQSHTKSLFQLGDRL